MTFIERFLPRIIKIGLWVIPFLPLYISGSMLFPFITGKNFAFRIIVELLFVFWVWLAIALPRYRPRPTPLVKAVTIFIIIVFLADLFGANPFRSFFSNFERMEGFMMLIHLYFYFLMLVSVFKTRRDWLIFLNMTLAASILVSLVALLQKVGLVTALRGGDRVDSTIGNPTYLAAYLLFHIWLLLLFLYEFWRKQWLRITYGAILLFELVILYFTATRGAVLALVISAILFLFTILLFWGRVFPGNPAGRRWGVGLLVVFLFVPLILLGIRDTDFVQSKESLQRLTNYSLKEGTIQARFMIWGMSWEGFKERPILGWGQENYYLVFQKYFNPGLFGEEPWFDRSHNIVFDWLIHAGILGLISYLSIFAVFFWMLARGVEAARVSFWEGLALAGMFVSYFLQNLFVFDNLNTYLLFFAFLAYAAFRTGASEHAPQEISVAAHSNAVRATGAGAVLLAAFFIWGYFAHIQPIQQARALIRAFHTAQDPDASIAMIHSSFEEALSFDAFGNTEVREQIGNFSRTIVLNQKFPAEERKRFLDFAIEEFRKETDHDARDVKHLLFLGSLLQQGGGFDPAYFAEADAVFRDALALSPTKQLVAFQAAQFYLATRQHQKAADLLYRVWLLEKKFTNAGINAWIAAALAGYNTLVEKIKADIRFETLDAGVLASIGTAYRRAENFSEALKIYERVVELAPDDPNQRAILAALYGYFGRIEDAEEQVREAVRVDPSFEAESEEFLKLLKQ